MYLGIALLSLGVVGCRSVAPRPGITTLPAPAEAPDFYPSTDPLTSGDVLALRFPYRPAQDQDVVVRTDGRINVPYAGSVLAGGRTVDELQAQLRHLYDSLAYDPTRGTDRKQYLINVGDQLEIRFRDAQQFDATIPVRPDGRISLPLVKSVLAEGKTPETLQAELIAAYGKFLRTVDLVVIVRQFTSDRAYVDGRIVRPGAKDLDEPTVNLKSFVPRQVFVAGEVRNPGFVTFQPPLTALQAVISAGGTPRTAKLSRVIILRKVGVEQPTAIVMDLSADIRGRAANDVPLRPFDIVIVPKTRIARVNDALDQYLYQLIPATRNINFTYFYDIGSKTP